MQKKKNSLSVSNYFSPFNHR